MTSGVCELFNESLLDSDSGLFCEGAPLNAVPFDEGAQFGVRLNGTSPDCEFARPEEN